MARLRAYVDTEPVKDSKVTGPRLFPFKNATGLSAQARNLESLLVPAPLPRHKAFVLVDAELDRIGARHLLHYRCCPKDLPSSLVLEKKQRSKFRSLYHENSKI